MNKILLTALFGMLGLLATAQDTAQIDLKPKFKGTLRGKYEYSFNDNVGRFAVRSARASVAGNINSWVSYLVQVDLCDDRTFRVLDLAIQMKPIENLTVDVGQIYVPFAQKYMITPGTMMFANRTFVDKYMETPTRDIGVYATYRIDNQHVPILLSGAVFNGSGINNPQWYEAKDLGYVGRLTFGSMDFMQASAKFLHSVDREAVENNLLAADFHYFSNNLTLEAEVSNGFYRTDSTKNQRLAWFLQGSYKVDLSKRLHYIEPTARWDLMKQIDNQHSNVNRLTFGVNFGFNQIHRKTELRLNFEKFWLNEQEATDYFGTTAYNWHDKVTLELLLNF